MKRESGLNNTKLRKLLGFPDETANLSFDEIVSGVSNYYERLIAKMPGHVYWLDADARTVGCNQNVLDSFGLNSINEFIGLSYEQQGKIVGWSEETTASFRADTFEVIKTGKAKTNVEEPPVKDPDGHLVYFLTTRVPVFNSEGQVIAVVGISTDITQLKKTQDELAEAKDKAEAANIAKTEFVQNMQHDIRTPSAGMWGVLDMLTKTETDSHKKEVLNMALSASKRLLDLCNDAVEFGDLSGNARPVLEKTLNLRDLAQSVVELNKPAAFAKDLVIHFKVDASVPMHILSDEFRISRILVNLVGNAIKFTNKGTVTLNLKAKVDEDTRRGLLTIEIKDTGIGIAAHKIESIYEKFTRAVASNTNKYPGTGLGLYVVKTFIDELNGDIEVNSYENEGSSFKLSIPFKVRWEDLSKSGVEINERFSSPLSNEIVEELKPNVKKAAHTKTPFTHHVLLVEDDKTCLFAEKQLMTAFTNKIDSAENVADALKKLALKRYDLVISDLGLPDGSGCDIVTQIKGVPKSLNYKTPFVAMTAHNDEQKLRQAMDAGFSAAETKPLTTETAVELLNIYSVPGTEQPKNEGLAVIDLALGMQRISVQEEGPAIEALSILYETLREDIPALQEAEQNNDIEKAREILHKIRGGLYYSGTPRLEETFRVLHDEVKRSSDLRSIDLLFSLAYGEVKLFAEEYKELVES